MKITYIKHSSFLVELEKTILLFDYFEGDIPTLDDSKNIYVLSSHYHQDHFNKKIFDLSDKYNNVVYILSNDIKISKNIKDSKKDSILFIKPHEEVQIDDLKIHTLKSTDQGVAFVINIEGENIYHAGDLHWWHWSGESDQYNKNMAKAFKSEIELIKDNTFDIAFLPLDPRLEEFYYLGFDYFMNNTNTNVAVAMHLWDDFLLVDKFINSDISKNYNDKIVKLSNTDTTLII